MRRLNVAQAKAQLSALLDAVERGEAVEITRRGIPVARLTAAPRQETGRFELASFLAATIGQPLHPRADAAGLVQELRQEARF